STRFPGKPLIDIAGKSLIQRVYLQTQKSNAHHVVVATDDERIYNHVRDFGGDVVITLESHPTGTDRCVEAFTHYSNQHFDLVLNIQGDEPFVDPSQINTLIDIFDDPTAEIGTLAKKIEDPSEIFDPKEVKIVHNAKHQVLYMSRSPIPHIHRLPQNEWHKHFDFYKHIGVYGFKADIIFELGQMKQTELEKLESLEQLRWLDKFVMKLGFTNVDTLSIDTPDDLKEIHKYL
ncbi:MAG: 3-deoxy-manno-octulosonate cytidylyltransferase, partial [Cytophagales bacterium]